MQRVQRVQRVQRAAAIVPVERYAGPGNRDGALCVSRAQRSEREEGGSEGERERERERETERERQRLYLHVPRTIEHDVDGGARADGAVGEDAAEDEQRGAAHQLGAPQVQVELLLHVAL